MPLRTWPPPEGFARDPDLVHRFYDARRAQAAAAARPDVVWFGEISYGMDVIDDALTPPI